MSFIKPAEFDEINSLISFFDEKHDPDSLMLESKSVSVSRSFVSEATGELSELQGWLAKRDPSSSIETETETETEEDKPKPSAKTKPKLKVKPRAKSQGKEIQLPAASDEGPADEDDLLVPADEEKPKAKSKVKVIGKRGKVKEVETEDGDEEESEDSNIDLEKAEQIPVAPITPFNINTKVAKTAKPVKSDKIANFYANLVKLSRKIDWLESIDESDLDASEARLHNRLLVKAVDTYNDAMDEFEELVEKNFPDRLNSFAEEAKVHTLRSLSERDEETGDVEYYFDKKGVSSYRTARAELDEFVYSYVLHIQDVEDGEDFKFKDYYIVVSQKTDSEGNVGYFVTRKLKESLEFEVGNQFIGSAGLKKNINAILNADQIKSHERLVIPIKAVKRFTAKILDDAIHEVRFIKNKDIIRVILKDGQDEDAAQVLAPKLSKALTSIMKNRSLSAKYSIPKKKIEGKTYIDLIIIVRDDNLVQFSRAQLLDMRERYAKDDDDLFDELIKRIVAGN